MVEGVGDAGFSMGLWCGDGDDGVELCTLLPLPPTVYNGADNRYGIHFLPIHLTPLLHVSITNWGWAMNTLACVLSH